MSRTTAIAKPIAKPIVYIVDDDVSVRESLEGLIAESGWRPAVFASAAAFLEHPRETVPSCLVLDVNMPQLNGLELQQRVADRVDLPIIFITGNGDIPMSVRAMKAGAVEFLTKPFGPEVMVDAIQAAIERSRASLARESGLQVLRDHYQSLTTRERQVMALVVRGQLNKQIAGELDIAEITVKVHRGQVMRKMASHSVAELVDMAASLGLATAGQR